jgi:hypothetical protein
MDRRLFALASVVLGLALGIAGDLLFYQKWLGISFPLFVALALAALFGLARLAGSASSRRNLWPVVPLGFFALMVAVRADASITLLNIGAVLWLAALILYYRPLPDPLDDETLDNQAQAVIATAVCAPLEPPKRIGAAVSWLRERKLFGVGPLRAVGRGLLIAVPITMVFGVLLFSADVIFADYVYRAMHIVSIDALWGAAVQGGVALVIGWICCGALAFGVLRGLEAAPAASAGRTFDPIGEFSLEDDFGAAVSKPKRTAVKPFRLGMVESGIVFGAVNLMFGAFVMIQLAYFFGGQEIITAETGWTYAQYARRGFFELLAVSVLTLGLILWLDRVTPRSTVGQHILFRVLAFGMVGLTGVMLVSASSRMSLYQDAYGFTHLRVYTHVFMLWLGVLFGVVLLSLFYPRRRVFAFGATLCAIGFLTTLNLMNVDATIAGRNLARAGLGHDLDIGYVYTLSPDAVPIVLSHYLSAGPSGARDDIGRWLSWQLRWLDARRQDRGLFSAHLSHDMAWAQLDAARDRLPYP